MTLVPDRVLRVGFGPYSVKPHVLFHPDSPNGKYSGFVVDLFDDIAAIMGLEFQFVEHPLAMTGAGAPTSEFIRWNSDEHWAPSNVKDSIHGIMWSLWQPGYTYKPSEHLVFSAPLHRTNMVGYVYQVPVSDGMFRLFLPFSADVWYVSGRRTGHTLVCRRPGATLPGRRACFECGVRVAVVHHALSRPDLQHRRAIYTYARSRM